MRTLQERRAKYMSTAPIYEALLISARQACAVANQNGRRTGPAAVQLLLVALSPVRDLLFCAKHLFVEAMVQKTAAVRQRRSGDGRPARPRWRRSRRAGDGSERRGQAGWRLDSERSS